MHEGRLTSEGNDASRTAEQLFDLEAVVIKEINNRSISNSSINEQLNPKSITEQFGKAGSVTKHVENYDISAANLLTLTEVGTGSALMREKSAVNEQAKLDSRGLDDVEVKDLGDVLRKSELTINIKTEHLISGINNIFDNPNKPIVNIFHLHEQGVDPKGKDYLDQRDATEKKLFPELNGHKLNADERPVYGALNVKGHSGGALNKFLGYGSSAIVLKPEVAKRATYVLNDSFISTPINLSAERRENFYKLLNTANSRDAGSRFGEEKIPQSLINALQDVNSKERKEFDAYLDSIQGDSKNCIVNAFAQNNLPESLMKDHFAANQEQKDAQYESFASLLIECFGDSEAARNSMVTHDNLESLLPRMTSVDGNNFANAVIKSRNGDDPKAVLKHATYIEAQIQGAIIPSRDIAEIRIDISDVPEDKQDDLRAQAKQYTRQTGIKITFVDEEIHNTDDANDEDLMREQNQFNYDNFDKQELNKIQDNYIEHLQEKIQEAINNTPILTKGLPEGALTLKDGAINHLIEKFNMNCNIIRNRKQSMDNEAICHTAFNDTIKPILQLKSKLLHEIQNMNLTDKQKAAVTEWIVSAKALKNTDELNMVLKNAQAQAEAFKKIADADPPLTHEQVLEIMMPVIKNMDKDIKEYSFNINEKKNGEFGAEDQMTELNRMSFMALTLLENSDHPLDETGLKKLADQLGGQEMSNLLLQMNSIPDNNLNHVEQTGFNNLKGALYRNAANINEKIGRNFNYPSRFIGEYSLLQQPIRNLLHEFTPEFATKLDAEHPAYPTFPAPKNQAMMPKNEAERRNFLVNNVLDNYKEIELNERGRATHGRNHIARAYIFANVMCNILEEQGIKVDKNAVLCGIAGHDMGREGTGDDYWEKQSADKTVEAMKNAFGPDSMGGEYEQEVKNCIDKHKSNTIEGMLLNAADSLDIGRLGPKTFVLDKFAFLHGKNGEVPSKKAQEIRKQLEKEAELLQCLTNHLCANRPAVDQYEKYNTDLNGPMSDLFGKMKNNLLENLETKFAEDRKIDSDTYMKGIEDVIRNKEMFPLLSKYYH